MFNSNLTYITRLFTEHSTTKAEKQSILKRFDQATNLVESKKLYKVISNELETRKPITESLENKLIKELKLILSVLLFKNKKNSYLNWDEYIKKNIFSFFIISMIINYKTTTSTYTFFILILLLILIRNIYIYILYQ